MTKDGQICNEAHHSIIHDVYIEGFVLHITRGFDNSFSDTLLMICEVDCLSTKTNTIYFFYAFFSQVRNIPERIILISTTGLR